MTDPAGFVPPPYPYDRLDDAAGAGRRPRRAGCVDLSIGTPCDPPPAAVDRGAGPLGRRARLPALDRHGRLPRGRRRLDGAPPRRDGRPAPRWRPASAPRSSWPALPHWLRLRRPDRDTVLYPAISYPTYAMGATLAGCRAVPVPVDAHGASTWRPSTRPTPPGRCACGSTRPATRPAASTTSARRPRWGRAHGVPVCQRRVLRRVHLGRAAPHRSSSTALDGVLAVHSLSKRSNLAGRAGRLLRRRRRPGRATSREVRKHAGFMVPGPGAGRRGRRLGRRRPTSTSSASATGRRLERMPAILGAARRRRPAARRRRSTCGRRRPTATPGRSPAGSPTEAGVLGQPGRVLRRPAPGYVRVAVVQPDDRLALVGERLAALRGSPA